MTTKSQLSPPRTTRHAAGVTLLLATLLALTACSGTVLRHGDGTVAGVYSMGTLKAELSPEFRVPSVIVAAKQALIARGYTVAKSEATEERGTVVAKSPGDNRLESMEVSARASAKGTRVSITRWPVGDEVESRVILDAILYRLGF